MNELDIVFLVLAAVFTLRGLLRGAIRESLCLAGVLAGLGLAFMFGHRLAPYLEGLVASQGGRQALAFMAVFIAVALAGWFLARYLRKRVGAGGLGWLDYLLGGAVGLAEGAVICAVVMVLLSSFFSGFVFVRESVFGPKLLRGAAVASGCLPETARERMRECGIRLPEDAEEMGRDLKDQVDSLMDSFTGNDTETGPEPQPDGTAKEI